MEVTSLSVRWVAETSRYRMMFVWSTEYRSAFISTLRVLRRYKDAECADEHIRIWFDELYVKTDNRLEIHYPRRCFTTSS